MNDHPPGDYELARSAIPLLSALEVK